MTPAESEQVRQLGEDFDPFCNPYLADPYPFFARARAITPVFYSPRLKYWVVTRYHDIQQIFQMPESYSASNVLQPIQPICPKAAAILAEVGFAPVRILTDNDPPGHTRVRRLVNVAFTPKRIAAIETFVHQLMQQFFQKHHVVPEDRAGGPVDLVRDLAWELPALVLFRMLGIPDEDLERVKGGSGHRLLMLWGRPSEDQQIQLAEGMAPFWRYAQEMAAARAQHPRGDLISDLLLARDGNLPALTHQEVTSLTVILLAAGHETTTGLLSNAFRQLLTHRDTWDDICRDPSLIPNALEEVLRFDSSVIAWRRKTTRAVEIGGVPIPEGADLLLLTGSANRDPAMFEDPERFDIRRPNAKEHLSFGSGRHFCMGAPLARLEARVVFEDMCARLPGLRLASGQPLQFQANTTFRGPLSLLAEWDQVAGTRTATV